MPTCAPQIEPAEFQQRRQQLLAELADQSAVLVAAAPQQSRNSDVEWPFRQDSYFYYLTGFDEPHAWLLLLKKQQQTFFYLFCQPRDKQQEIWNGFRYGPEGACRHFQADHAWSTGELDEQLPRLLDGIETLYYLQANRRSRKAINHWLDQMRAQRRKGLQVPYRHQDLAPLLDEMRLIKSPAEQAMLRHAAAISAKAHVQAMQHCQPGRYEYQLDAQIQHCFLHNGCRLPAYSSIVGSGANGCVLHYVANRAPLISGDLVLIDAGCEWGYYAGDITRTFPVNGHFSAEQRALYQLVLDVNQACIDLIRPGISWHAPHELSVRLLTEGLVALGLLQGDVATLIEQEAYQAFYMHKLGHWLGLDVHDVGNYKIDGEWRQLQPGMVMTVEPGLYIAPDNQAVEPRWRGIGIRIEDDVLVTEQGADVLSAGVPKTIAAIEALMNQSDSP